MGSITYPSVPPTRQVIAGTNMTGGGPLTGDVTLNASGGGASLMTHSILLGLTAPFVVTSPDTNTTIVFNTEEYQNGNLTAAAGVITVGAGIDFIILVGGLLGASLTAQFVIKIIKNGASTQIGLPSQDTDTSGGDSCSVMSAVIPVVEGDTFELQCYSTSAPRTIDISNSFFGAYAVT